MGVVRNLYNILVGKPEGKQYYMGGKMKGV
jgi:hypothetical protein